MKLITKENIPGRREFKSQNERTTMKVISILQPWASLIVLGHKRIETRSWNTKYRGPILIHASAGKKELYRELLLDFHQEFDLRGLPNYRDLPFGAIIGSTNLVDTKHVEEFSGLLELTHQERIFGDYSPGRYGWMLEGLEKLPYPIPAKGKLGIWEFEGLEAIGT
jgi:activating signal cointegrator 1